MLEEVSNEKLAEIQKDLETLCEKHGVDLKTTQKLELSVFPRAPKEEPKPEEAVEVKA